MDTNNDEQERMSKQYWERRWADPPVFTPISLVPVNKDDNPEHPAPKKFKLDTN